VNRLPAVYQITVSGSILKSSKEANDAAGDVTKGYRGTGVAWWRTNSFLTSIYLISRLWDIEHLERMYVKSTQTSAVG